MYIAPECYTGIVRAAALVALHVNICEVGR
jgi:hypothetical protein